MEIKPIVVHQNDCLWASRETYPMTPNGQVRWKTLLSSDQTPSSEITMGLAEIPPEQKLQLHSHPQAETYYILSGEGFVLLDGVRELIRAGSVVFIPGNVVHTIGTIGDQALRFLYSFPVDSFSDVIYDRIS